MGEGGSEGFLLQIIIGTEDSNISFRLPKKPLHSDFRKSQVSLLPCLDDKFNIGDAETSSTINMSGC